jgi:integrase/recombinase XerD
MAKTPKVRLYMRTRSTEGRDVFLDPAWNRNHTLRAGYALAHGKPEHHPEGIYYLRFLRRGKRVWQSVGSEADAAIVALRNTEHDLQAVGLGRSVHGQSAVAQTGNEKTIPSVPLGDATKVYLDEIRRFRAPKTIAACELMLGQFSGRFSSKVIKDITRKDLLDHMSFLREKGNGDRTIHNHIARISTFLKLHGIVGLLSGSDKPKYDEKAVTAYHSDELAVLFAAASPEEEILFEFFLSTGFREQEVMFATWANVDFANKIVSVWSKPELGFRVKDKEERSVPVPDSLIKVLAERKKNSSSMLMFPSPNGTPNGHFLRLLQQLALRTGLNCGECTTKNGETCATRPVCGQWGLHKFRKTFATMHSEAGVSAPTIQTWLGHSDLATTLRYLAVADLRSERTRNQVNATFTALGIGGPA